MSGKKSESSEKREKKRERESEEKARPAALGFSPAKKLEVKFVFACSSRGCSSSASSGIPWKIKADIQEIGTASARMLRETAHSQGNSHILPRFILFVQKTIKYLSVYGIPLRSICDEVSHGRSKLIFKKLEPLLRGC